MALLDIVRTPEPLPATVVPATKQAEASTGVPIGTRSLVPGETETLGEPEVQLFVDVKTIAANKSEKVDLLIACPTAIKYAAGIEAPDQGMTLPTGMLPGTSANTPSARRNLVVPPPEAGTAPERREVKILIRAVS